jgi:hypothetical protein
MSVLSKCTGGILVYGTLAAVAILVSGCGGGSGGGGSATGGGAESTGTDAAAPASDSGSVAVHREAGAIADSGGSGSTASSSSGASSGATPLYDNTVGNTCASDLDCQPAGGPGVNTCSSTTFKAGALFPTPVCILTKCDLGTDGQTHYCDGPDDLSATPPPPGVCVNVAGSGLCLPLCVFLNDGSAALGCQVNDACVPDDTWGKATLNGGMALAGIGFCLGGCTKDADCPTGNLCQVDQGLCVTTVTPTTKTIGTACTAADNTAGTCNCYVNSQTMSGNCSQFCTTGSTADPCPAGYVCDALEPTELIDSSDAGVPGFLTQNPGLSGACVATCTDEGGTCAGSFSCFHDTPVGPDCLP